MTNQRPVLSSPDRSEPSILTTHVLQAAYIPLTKAPYKLTVTPSVHSAYKHTRDWYDRHGLSPGLGWYCEQAIETSHSEWKDNVWPNFKVPDTHPRYEEKLLSAMGTFNADRI